MDKKNKTYYLPIYIALGAGVGAVFDQIPIGICMGMALGVVFSSKKEQ